MVLQIASLTKTAAVILAAGRGTRMKSDLPKVLHPLLGRPLVGFPVALAQRLSLQHIVVVTGYRREAVEAAVTAQAPNARFALQAEQLGTGHAVLMAESATEGADLVLVLYGDVPTLSDATVEAMAKALGDAPFTMLAFEADDPTGYGRVETTGDRVTAIVEHKDCTEAQRAITLVNAGVYLARRAFLYDALRSVGSANAAGEYYLTDIATIAHAAGTPGVVLTVSANEVVGVNDRAQLADLETRMRGERNRDLMRSGVTMIDPARTRVGLDCTLAEDVTLHPDVTLSAATIGRGATIGQGAVLTRATVGEGAVVLPYCVVTDSTLGPNTQIGPFTHVRPGTVLHERAKLGNFVETKKTTLGEGSKANHLTYLGDCTIGEAVNVGAGTITCNYDGVNKHQTEIRDRAFIGSNTEIVAPAVIGEDALVGAGTTVTRDVPDGALAVSRAPQKNIEGWSLRHGPTARRRKKGS